MAGGTLNPAIRIIKTGVQITYDTDDENLNKTNTTAEARKLGDGVQFLFTGNSPNEHPHSHTSGVIPSKAVIIKSTNPTLTFNNGNVNALYEIKVADMGGVCSNEVSVADPNLIIDVEKVLADSTWELFKSSCGKFERKLLKRKNYQIEVPMQYYHFEEVECQMTGRTRRPQGATGLGTEKGLTNSLPNGGTSGQVPAPGESHLAGKGLAHSDQTSPSQIGLQTEFNNDTDEKQTYTFQFEKVRTASVEVSYQKGYSWGVKANFTVGLPKVLGDGSVGVEVDKHLEVTKSTGERFEESLKTSATSDIVVSARSRYIATVTMEEKLLLANFKTVVEMTMPARKAPIYIKNLKTGENEFVRTICCLPRIFKKFKNGVVSPVKDEEGRDRTDAVRFTVEGIIDGVQLSTHKIHLQSFPLGSQADTDHAGKTTSSKSAAVTEKLVEM